MQRSAKAGARINLHIVAAIAATAQKLGEAKVAWAEAQEAAAKRREETVATSEAAMLTFAAAAAAAKDNLARLCRQVQTVDSQVGLSNPAGLLDGFAP